MAGTEQISLHSGLRLPHCWTKSIVREDLRYQTEYCAGYTSRLHVLLPLALYPETQWVAVEIYCTSPLACWNGRGLSLSHWWEQVKSWQWALVCYNWRVETIPDGWGRHRLSSAAANSRRINLGEPWVLNHDQNSRILITSHYRHFLPVFPFHFLKVFCSHPHAYNFWRLSPFNDYVPLHSKINSSTIINCKFIAFCQGGESVTSHKH